jgi:2-isopropylmalate synthase
MVQGTVNGYGERCGNADITSIIPVLKLKMGLDCISDANLSRLKSLSRFVSETANQVPFSNRPFVGESAFAHKGGIHVSAIMKEPRAYEHIDPKLVGNDRRILMSDLAGKSNVVFKAREMGIALESNGTDSRDIVDKVKELEDQGYQFDVADGSLKILLEKFTQQYVPRFELKSFRVSIEKDEELPCSAHATIKIAVGDNQEITAAEGQGPVSALDNALRKALVRFYPELKTMRLVDFKVRVIDGRDATAAKVRVLIASRDQDEVWYTIGVSKDIIEASWQALTDSFQYKLAKEQGKRSSSAALNSQAI